MANPSWSVNAFAKHIALHLYQYPVAVKWGGNKNIKSLVLAQRNTGQVVAELKVVTSNKLCEPIL